MPFFVLPGGPNGVGKSPRTLVITKVFPDMVAIDGDLVVKQLKEKNLPQTLAEGIIQDKSLQAVQMQRDILIESNLNTPLSYGYRDYALQ